MLKTTPGILQVLAVIIVTIFYFIIVGFIIKRMIFLKTLLSTVPGVSASMDVRDCFGNSHKLKLLLNTLLNFGNPKGKNPTLLSLSLFLAWIR